MSEHANELDNFNLVWAFFFLCVRSSPEWIMSSLFGTMYDFVHCTSVVSWMVYFTIVYHFRWGRMLLWLLWPCKARVWFNTSTFSNFGILKVCSNDISTNYSKYGIIFSSMLRVEAFTSLQQYHLQIITMISPARDSSKQTVNRDILVMACQSFSVNDCVLS